MARAYEQLLIGVPFSDVAAGMHADRGISDDTLGGMLLRLRIKTLRIETQQQDLIEARAVAHGAGLWIHRPAEGLPTFERQILGCQWLWGSSTNCNQNITLARSFAGRIGLRQSDAGGQREA